MNDATVSSKIRSLHCCKERALPARLDVWPFAVLYAVLVGLWCTSIPLLWLAIPPAILLHGIVLLGSFWSVWWKGVMSFSSATSIGDTSHVLVLPHPHMGNTALCPLQKNALQQWYFDWEKRRYVWDESHLCWRRREWPVHHNVSHYTSYGGHTTDALVDDAVTRWGRNTFAIPAPTFRELYLEHALAPFFVFQVFCVGLWCLDDYWMYSVFTLVMLFIFEATVVKKRLANVTTLRSMIRSGGDTRVWRSNRWVSVPSSELVPGDVIALTRGVVPCDAVLVRGGVVVNEAALTGESTPLIKEAITSQDPDHELDLKTDRVNVVFSGTKVVQLLDVSSGKSRLASDLARIDPTSTPLAHVVRTGFSSAQGKVLRSIMFSTQRMTANTWESFLFILFLLCFALAASAYVLVKGLEDPDRSRWKLFLECTIIITSVVPPELPIELSLAVQQSLLNLKQLGIWCTEPFRIPFAGRVQVCCFDKTGTLSSERLVFHGVVPPSGDFQAVEESVNPAAQAVIGGCHSLMVIGGHLEGDPMERYALGGIGWSMTVADHAHQAASRSTVRVLRRFHFTSFLKRMTTVASVRIPGHTSGGEETRVLMKGAPEVVYDFLAEKPSNYDASYRHWAEQGDRIIALAWKPLPVASAGDKAAAAVRRMTREELEGGLTFAGFVLFRCRYKANSWITLSDLAQSGHENVMITGDNELTACHVARHLGIVEKEKMLILHATPTPQWRPTDGSDRTHAAPDTDVAVLAQSYDLCMSGDSVDWAARAGVLPRYVQLVKVFARTSPDQKATVLRVLKENGTVTLMCGDGTNDVGALKQAHIGLALLTAKEREVDVPDGQEPRDADLAQRRAQEEAAAAAAARQAAEEEEAKAVSEEGLTVLQAMRKGRKGGRNRAAAKAPKVGSKAKKDRGDAQRGKKKRAGGGQSNAPSAFMSGDDVVQMGDASIASPFTIKSYSIAPIISLFRQGRCALVTTVQMYKILCVQCLVTAYSLSVLSLDGIKYGDTQMTIMGLVIAAAFFFISRAKPAERLANERPLSNLFCPYMLVSIMGQFGIHLTCLIATTAFTKAAGAQSQGLDDDFEPTLLNSTVFLISTAAQLANFATNYMGRPHMQSLRENKALAYTLSVMAGVIFVAATGLLPPVGYMLELVYIPLTLRLKVVGLMLADAVAVFAWDRGIRLVLKHTG